MFLLNDQNPIFLKIFLLFSRFLQFSHVLQKKQLFSISFSIFRRISSVCCLSAKQLVIGFVLASWSSQFGASILLKLPSPAVCKLDSFSFYSDCSNRLAVFSNLDCFCFGRIVFILYFMYGSLGGHLLILALLGTNFVLTIFYYC